MKNVIKSFVVFNLFILFLTNVNALTASVKTSYGVNFRSTPSINEDNIIASLSYNAKVTLNDNTTYSGDGCDKGWYKVTYSNKEGYICSEYLTINNTTTGIGNYYTTTLFDARVNSTTLNVRKNASSSSSSKALLIYGENLKILSSADAGNGCNDEWYRVSYQNSQTGYVCSTYVKRYIDLTDNTESEENTEYCNSLMSAGFPKSYCPYLIKMHKDHPNWIFNPVITNLNWSTVVTKETGKNYFSKSISTPSYRASDKLLDGGAWYEATSPVVAFFLDPRNFLNEENIFMFETLTYNDEVNTSETLSNVLNGTDLNNETAINAFLKYGKKYNVSAISAAARVIQEGVTSSSSNGLSGKSTLTYRGLSLKGYYNLFNIGAYQDSYTTNPVARGLAFACGALGSSFDSCGTYTTYSRPWTSVSKAINGGINFLGGDYISVGQYTLYFQKFNTANSNVEGSSPNYTHQYMTNIEAPQAEGNTMYNLYKRINVLNEVAFSFSIPVYKSMPDEIVTLPPIGNNNNTLSSIKINDVLISNFDSDVIDYTKYVTSDTNTITISATPTSPTSIVTGEGQYSLNENENIIQITVTSETNEEKTYTIKIIKNAEGSTTIDKLIKGLDVKSNDNYLYIDNPKIDVSSLIININKVDADAKIEVLENNIKKENGTFKTNDKINITLGTGETKSFDIILLGDTNSDGKIDIIDLLRTQKHILNSSTLTNANLESADTNLDNNVDIIDLLRIQKYILKAIEDFK